MSKSSKSARDNRANQLNPTHAAYHQSRGISSDDAQQMAGLSKPALDNRANQLNPNNAAHAASRCESMASSASSNPSRGKSE
ncbi:MAG: hypothetical protein SangKO_068130 [Sandaracinaceae bacterium]